MGKGGGQEKGETGGRGLIKTKGIRRHTEPTTPHATSYATVLKSVTWYNMKRSLQPSLMI